MLCEIECTYCSFKWTKYIYDTESFETSCPKCKDKNIKVKKHKTVDYYAKKETGK
jgi:Zn finger protein HypA/HybF involved in hydrogenase expression